MSRMLSAAAVLALLLTAALPAIVGAQDFEKEQERYFMTRDDCGAEDNIRLDTRPGGFEGGCALVVSPANEVLNAAGEAVSEVYPQGDGESYLIDTEEALTGQITTFGFLGQGTSLGVATFDVTVTANYDMFETVTLVEETFENVALTGAEQTLEFTADIDDALAGEELRNFQVEVMIRGVHAEVTLNTGGDSFITVPYLVPVEPTA